MDAKFILIAATVVLGSLQSASSQTIVDFEDLPLAPGTFYNGGPTTNSTGWVSGGVLFGNGYNSNFGGFWNGFSYSNINDPTTPGFGNQYAAFVGQAFSGSTYAIAYSGSMTFINLPAGTSPVSIRVTNTTYAAFDMLNGSGFSKKFGGATGDDPDFLDLTFTGYDTSDATGTAVGAVTFRLADYTFADNTQDYIVGSWELVNLSTLADARSIRLTWASSDVGAFGINTPVYAAIDDLILIPEPAALSVAFGAALLGLRRKR